jgi:azurin
MWDKMSLEQLKTRVQEQIKKVSLNISATGTSDDYYVGKSDAFNFVLMLINDMEKGIKQ